MVDESKWTPAIGGRPVRDKIDLDKLHTMLTIERKTGNECAKYFGCTGSAITRAKRRMAKKGLSNIDADDGKVILKNNTTLVDQLTEQRNFLANELKFFQKVREGNKHYLKKMSNFYNNYADGRIKMSDPSELALKYLVELRKNAEAVGKLMEIVINAKAIEEFMRISIEEIKKADPEVADAIYRRLAEQQALRGPV